MSYPVYSPDDAPDGARETLAGARKAFGFVPNMIGTMAGAPALVKAYLTLARLFDDTSLTPAERQVVLLSISHENGCEYCLAAHTAIATMQGVPADVVRKARRGDGLPDPRLDALRTFARAVVARRGHPTADEQADFHAAGFSRQQVLEVLLGVGLKTLSNYTNHIADTPIDRGFLEAVAAVEAVPA